MDAREPASRRGVEREWVLREHLQRLVLYALAQLNLNERYTLQGGAALRLAYGSPRLSLDLDFTLEGAAAESQRHARILRNFLGRALAPEDVGVELAGFKLEEAGGFHRYFLVFDTRRLVGRKLRVKVEVLSRRYSRAHYELKTVARCREEQGLHLRAPQDQQEALLRLRPR